MVNSPTSRPGPRQLVMDLIENTAAGRVSDELILSWDPRTLLNVDVTAHNTWEWTAPKGRAANPHELPLLSMYRDGYRREEAVHALRSQPGPAADRLLALRLGDHVPQIRRAAWAALMKRPLPGQADVVVPVLVALRGRFFGERALESYIAAVEKAWRHPVWREFLAHPDRATRRWAVGEQIAHGLTPTEALHLLNEEHDLFLARALVDVVVADREAARRLLVGHSATGRRRALETLPDDNLSIEEVETAMLDHSAIVRRVAAYQARRRGVDPLAWYRDRWSSTSDRRALAGLLEEGGTLDHAEAHNLLHSPSPALRKLAIRSLARQGLKRDDLAELWPLLDSSAASQVVRALTRSFCWSWTDVAERWEGADERLRRRLWRLLSSRSGWDEVRAHLLAATDPQLTGLGRSGLDAWALHRSSRMYRNPTPEQRDHLLHLLARADIDKEQHSRIRFIGHLP